MRNERYHDQAIYHALRENKNHFSAELAKDILSGKHGFMCQYERDKGVDTVWSVIYDVKNKKIFRVEGNPSRKKFVEDKRMKFENEGEGHTMRTMGNRKSRFEKVSLCFVFH